jgi:hypothetical protein
VTTAFFVERSSTIDCTHQPPPHQKKTNSRNASLTLYLLCAEQQIPINKIELFTIFHSIYNLPLQPSAASLNHSVNSFPSFYFYFKIYPNVFSLGPINDGFATSVGWRKFVAASTEKVLRQNTDSQNVDCQNDNYQNVDLK